MNFINPTLWNYELPWGQTWGDLFEIFKEKNVVWFKDRIVFNNVHEPTIGWYMDKDWERQEVTANYSYGMIISKEQYYYGIYTMTCLLPNFRGSWPAWWMIDVTNDMGIPPEVDLMEHFRKDCLLTRFKTTHTYHDSKQGGGYDKMICKAKWQWFPVDNREMTFTFDWTASYMKWYVNGKLILQIMKADVNKFPNKPMNLLVGSGMGNWNIQNSKLKPLIVTKLERS